MSYKNVYFSTLVWLGILVLEPLPSLGEERSMEGGGRALTSCSILSGCLFPIVQMSVPRHSVSSRNYFDCALFASLCNLSI